MGLFKNILGGVTKFASTALGGPLLTTGLQLGANLISAKKEREYATDAWNRQNAYNSPVQQLARFQAAGMNPAYGGGVASGNADKMSDAATSVARVEIPNILQNLGLYQSLKNQVLEGDRLKAITEGEILKNEFLSGSMPSRITYAMHKSDTEQGKSMLQDYELQKAVAVSNVLNRYPKEVEQGILSKYQLETQRFNQNTKMNAIDYALANLSLNTKRFGLNESDSAFLRVLAQMWNGSDKGAGSMLPYVIGEKAVSFIGDIAKTATPKLPFQRYQFNTKPIAPQRRGFSTMRPNYEFDK